MARIAALVFLLVSLQTFAGGVDFPRTVPVAITQVQHSKTREALWIQTRLNAKNLTDLAAYFSNPTPPLNHLKRRLGAHAQIWIDINPFVVDLIGDTNALEALIASGRYCEVPVSADPQFGDIIRLPGVHAARYVMKDPQTNRAIVMSVHEDVKPYRFWWLDEEFGVDKRWRAKLEVWRVCKK